MNAEQADDEMARVLGACMAADEAAVVAAAPPPDEEPRMPWPEEWFQRRDRFDLVACQRMWGEVLLSCLRGALGVSSSHEDYLTGKVAPEWIGSKDFLLVCDYAGVATEGLLACLDDPPRRAALMETLRYGNGKTSGK